jgi:HIV Tat-specific factor 1
MHICTVHDLTDIHIIALPVAAPTALQMEFPDPPPHPSLIEKDPKILKTVDERIAFDQKTSMWLFETKDVEYQYNFVLQQWLPTQSETSSAVDVDTRENAAAIRKRKKQKIEEMRDAATAPQAVARTPVNTGVFVSNLPMDTTKAELAEAFGKFGIISEDFKTGEKRIKFYHDDEGRFKGEVLVIYLNPESVDLAIQMLDDTLLRAAPPTAELPKSRIKVEPAQFDAHAAAKDAATARKALTAEEKKLLQNKTNALKRKLADWGEPLGGAASKADIIKRKIWDKIVIIESMFRPAELQQDAMLEVELKQDIQEECDKLGIGRDITKIVIYNVSAVVMVKFSNPELSEKCIAGFGGRFYDGLKLKVRKYSGESFESSEKGATDERIG